MAAFVKFVPFVTVLNIPQSAIDKIRDSNWCYLRIRVNTAPFPPRKSLP